jgi:branched-chain amino acid transport system substrate-binding protein
VVQQVTRRFVAAAVIAASVLVASGARGAEPITIGLGMALTGGLAAGGKSALLGMQIWRDNVNAKGGLMGRPVKLINYDDQSNPATVPGIYTKLLEVDKVDFIVSGYGTNMIAPAMPVAIQHDRLFLGLFGLAVNSEFHYPKYFSMLPTGPDPKHAFSEPFFKVVMAKEPKPKTLAIVAADAEYPKNASEGARDTAKSLGLQIVYDKSYPPSTADFSPIVHAIQATNAEIVFVASYPPDSAGMVRAATETGLKTRYFGGGMVGLQYTSVKQQFGSKLNGILDYDWWIPAPKMQFPGITEFLQKYQAKAPSEGIDPLGWYLPPFAYANLQVLGEAIEGAKTLDQAKLAAYIRTHPFNTIVGEVSFGKDGEWSKPRVLEVQFQDIQGTDLEQFRDTRTEAILEPAEYRTGELVEPYSSVKK